METEKYILAVDHGTSAVKTAIVSIHGRVIDVERQKTPINFLPGGGAEQDPADWWQALLKTGKALIKRKQVPSEDIIALSVSSTFSTTVAVDTKGDHLMPALTWMDSRGAPYIKQVMAGFPSILGYGLKNVLRWVPKTGGGPSLSGKDDIAHLLLTKYAFPEIYEKTYMFLPSKDYLNLQLTGIFGASYDSVSLFWVTDTRDINNIRYDDKLIDYLAIDRDKLPPLVPSTHILGPLKAEVADELGLSREVKVVSGSPDHQAAGIGAGAVRDFDGHIYIGTSSWIQCTVPFKKTDVLHSIASLPTAIPGKYYCANEQDMAGGCMNFLADKLLGKGAHGAADDNPQADPFQEIDIMAGQAAAGSGHLIFTPWLNGERTPVDDTTLRGGLYNLSKTTSTEEIARAFLEGVAYNTRWSLKYVEKFINRKMDPINMVGGGAQSDLWCQIHADVLNRTIRQVKDPMEANARGAAFIAAAGLGRINFDDIPELITYANTFTPRPENRTIYDRLFKEFITIYKNNKAMFRRLNR